MQFTFNRNIIIVPKRNVFALLETKTGTSLELDSDCLVLLLQLPSSFDEELFIKSFKNFYKEETSESIFLAFRIANIVLPISKLDSLELVENSQQYEWENYGWGIAKLYHQLVTYSEFIQGDEEGWREQIASGERISKDGFGPEMVKNYQSKEVINLPENDTNINVDFFKVLSSRRTRRNFNPDTKITTEQISIILKYAAKAHFIINHPHYGNQMFRTSPSGGARHPIEIYPQILNPEDLSLSGNFYYNPEKHQLIKLGDVNPSLFYKIGQQQTGAKFGSIGFLITARFPRNFWKYRYPKSYSFTLFDAGHLVQTLILVAEAIGLNSFLTPALDIKLSIEYLQLENIFDECPVYLVMSGKK